MTWPIPPLEGPISLSHDAVFTVGGERIHTEHPGASTITGSPGPGTFVVDHMYVHARVPEHRPNPAVVMVHGATGTGVSFETTPDGREGWSTWFLRAGHPVYVVDHAGRGRSGFDPTPINAARAGALGHGMEVPNVFLGTLERLWINTRVGPAFGEPFANSRFPVDAFDRFAAAHVPNTESTLRDPGGTTVARLCDLLDEIGPVVLLVHSQGGLYGLEVARRRPHQVLAVVSIEGGSQSVTSADARANFMNTPFLSVWGDNSHGAAGVNGDQRREGCMAAVEHITAAGGRADLLVLPELGIAGNSHAMMSDDNNLEIAQLVGQWLSANVG